MTGPLFSRPAASLPTSPAAGRAPRPESADSGAGQSASARGRRAADCPAPKTPTEGEARDTVTVLGVLSGETAATTPQAGADSPEVGPVTVEATPAAEKGGAGQPSPGVPPRTPGPAVAAQRKCAPDQTAGPTPTSMSAS